MFGSWAHPLFAIALMTSCVAPASPAGSGSPSPGAIDGTVTQSDAECTLSGASARAKAGHIRLAVVDRSTNSATFDMWRINATSSYQDLVAHVEKEKQRAAKGEPGLGHPTLLVISSEQSCNPGRVESLKGQCDPVYTGLSASARARRLGWSGRFRWNRRPAR